MSKRPGHPFRQKLEDLALDAIGLLGFLFILYLGEMAVKYLFGDVMLFGRYPFAYMIHGSDIALIVCFTINSCRKIFK
jgi:hypothetical protein